MAMKQDRTIVGNSNDAWKKNTGEIALYVTVVEGTEAGKKIEVGLNPIKLGRHPDNQFHLLDHFISGQHCAISVENGEVWVTDLNSTNGTFINGNPIKGRSNWPITAELQIGKQTLRHQYLRREEVRRSDELAHHLRQAADYVQSLLPAFLDGAAIRTAWQFVPSAQLGGDIFDYFYWDSERFIFYLLDVCGHGTGAALHSVSIFNLLRQKSLPQLDFSRPAQVLDALNEALPMDSYGNLYFTVWYGVYHVGEKTLTYASGGHPAALLFDESGHLQMELSVSNPPIGVIRNMVYKEKSVALNHGAKLYLFSDGVYEITTGNGEQWIWDNFVEMLGSCLNKGLSGPDSIYQEIKTIASAEVFEDDFSMLLLTFD